MKDKNKLIMTIVVITLAAIVIVGATYAYWSWTTSTNDQTNVTFRVTSDFSCGADGGGSITSQEKILAPTTCTNENYAFQRPIVVKPTINKNGKTIYMDLNLKVNSIGTYLSQSQYFKYALTTDSTSCTNGVVASGTFQGATTNTEIRLLHNKSYSSTTNDPYYLYIWLDKDETNNNTQNQPFDISLTGTCTDEAPTTFTGTIYRYSTENLSIGDSIVPETKQAWCANSTEFGNSCDFGYSWDTEQECQNYVTEQNMANTTCGQGTVSIGGISSYETNVSNLNRTIYLKHTVADDIVTESYVEFVVTPTMAGANNGMTAGTYYLKGGDNGTAFLDNAKTIYDAFGSNCSSNPYITTPSSDFVCRVSGLFGASAYSGGSVNVGRCHVFNDGSSNCYE